MCKTPNIDMILNAFVIPETIESASGLYLFLIHNANSMINYNFVQETKFQLYFSFLLQTNDHVINLIKSDLRTH